MITYLLIGILFAMVVELGKNYLVSIKMYPFKQETDPFNGLAMRMVVVIFWPLGLIWFAVGFYKGYTNKK